MICGGLGRCVCGWFVMMRLMGGTHTRFSFTSYVCNDSLVSGIVNGQWGRHHATIVTTPHGYKLGASGMTPLCRPTAFKPSARIFLLPLWSLSMTRPHRGHS